MAIIEGWPDAVTAALLVLFTFTMGITAVYLWRELASRYRQRRLDRRQQLPVHRMDLAPSDTRSISRTSTDRLESLSQKSHKHNKYRERILAATARRQKPCDPQQTPSSYGRSPKFEDISLQSPLVGNGTNDERGHDYRRNPGYGRSDDRKESSTGGTPLPPSRAWVQRGNRSETFPR